MTILCRLELNSALLSNSIFSYECASIFMWMLKTASLNLRHKTSSVSMKNRCQLWQTICICHTTHLQGKAYKECEGIKVERHETHSHNHKPLWAEDLVLLTHKTSTLNLIFATLWNPRKAHLTCNPLCHTRDRPMLSLLSYWVEREFSDTITIIQVNVIGSWQVSTCGCTSACRFKHTTGPALG